MKSILSNKKIIVTGGCGFIGTHLIRQLIVMGHVVANVDKLTYAGNATSLADIANHPQYRFHQLDIVNQSAIAQLFDTFRPDAVMHLAAETHVDRSIVGPSAFIQTNVVGTSVMLQESQRHFDRLLPPVQGLFRFLHVSTDEVYGSLGFEEPAFTETTAYDPHSPYSASKAGSDHLARAWQATYGLPVIVTHCSNNYGPFQFPEKLIPVVILKCLQEDSIPVYGQGENIRDWLHVSDHCEALVHVIERGTPGEIYNIGGNNERSNLELVQMLCRILDDLHPRSGDQSYVDLIQFVIDRPGHDLRYAIDSGKIYRELGWQPRTEFSLGLHQTVQWYLDNRDWWETILADVKSNEALARRSLPSEFT